MMSDKPNLLPPTGHIAERKAIQKVRVDITVTDVDGNETKFSTSLEKENEKDDLMYWVHQNRRTEPGWEEGEEHSSYFMDYGVGFEVSAHLDYHQCKRVKLGRLGPPDVRGWCEYFPAEKVDK